MTTRRLRVLIEHLPPESSTMTALRNALSPEEVAAHADDSKPEEGRWSQQELLLASLSDAVRALEHTLICLKVEKGKWPTRPAPMRRPGVDVPETKPGLSEARAETLFQLIHGGAA
ncbi:hypothetical protein ACWGHD_04625 [Streptomyces xanthophaeus]